MKKTIYALIAVLIIVYLLLSLVGRDNEYAAERALYGATKAYQKIAVNPEVVPPAMSAAVEKRLRFILEKYPKTNAAKTAHLALGEFYLNDKKYDEALKTANDLIDEYNRDRGMLSKARFLKGNVYERQGQWDKAVTEYKILRDNYTDTPIGIQIPLYIGDYFKRIGRHEESVKAYGEAANYYENLEKKNRGNALGYMASSFLVDSYLKLRNYEIAGKIAEDTIKNYPSNLTYLQYLPKVEAIYVKKLQRPDKAIEIYNSVKEKTTNARLKEALDKKIEALKGKGNMDSR